MDMNYLYARSQVELMRAAAASSREAREAHEELARLYRQTIDSSRKARQLGSRETA